MSVQRRWTWTLNNYTQTELEHIHSIRVDRLVRYLVYQCERGESGTPHIQGYIEFSGTTRFSRVKRILGERVHQEESLGSGWENKVYCSKEDGRTSGPWERGEVPNCESGQGTRNDIRSFVDHIRKGASDRELVERYPIQFLRYGHSIARVRRTARAPEREPPTVIVLYGNTGVGKSRFADSFDDTFSFQYGASAQWGDGYDGQEICWFDEFYGQLPFSTILSLTDRYVFRLDQRGGGGVYFTSPWIIFTSNIPPNEWWGSARIPVGSRLALLRRITHIINCHSQEEWDLEKGSLDDLPDGEHPLISMHPNPLWN